ncbi:hypothetical protein K4F52_005946 [Lecanicillium sp. MT-2017a]|nr:hypothetical protein K4F52_005946 [Lecanicillium sp. MT-2017a]
MAIQHPDINTVSEIVKYLRREGLPVAVGGSALLASLGIVDHVNDWDVTTEGDISKVTRALVAGGFEWKRLLDTERPFATAARFVVHASDHDIDVIVGFAAWDGDEVVELPVRESHTWLGLPMADPAVWARAYRLIGRTQRAELLDAWLAGRGIARQESRH